jgi:hypothetical protein
VESRTNVLAFALKAETAPGDLTFVSRRLRTAARKLIGILSAMLGPFALIAYVFAVWRLSADIGWSGPFIITSGFFSHWIVWFSIGLALNVGVSVLKRRPAATQS